MAQFKQSNKAPVFSLKKAPLLSNRWRCRTKKEVNSFSTNDWIETMSDFSKFSFNLRMAAFMGVILTSTLERAASAERGILMEVTIACILINLSPGIIFATKIACRIIKNPKLENIICRCGFFLACLVTSLGLLFLGWCLADAFDMSFMFWSIGGFGFLVLVVGVSFPFVLG